MNLCRRCVVQGKVQGVWFRASTQAEARRLGLSGHAINLADGSVEVLVCGPAAAVEELCAWLWRGPTHARVSGVSCEPLQTAIPAAFTTG